MSRRRDIPALFERHADTVYRVCYTFMGNAADTEDAVQEAFIRLMRSDVEFADEEHEKAWLIRVASNYCRDVLKSRARSVAALDEVDEPSVSDRPIDETLDAVMRLDERYKDAVYLYYYEGYSSDEVAAILEKPPSTVRSYLSEARAILREKLGGGRP